MTALSADGSVLSPESIRFGRTATDQRDAVVQCGRLLVEIGAVDKPYVDAMCERELGVSTYVGRGVALPHAIESARRYVRRTALAVLCFPDGVHWADDEVFVCVAIAAAGDQHVGLMSRLALLLLDERRAAELCAARDAATVLALLGQDGAAARSVAPVAARIGSSLPVPRAVLSRQSS